MKNRDVLFVFLFLAGVLAVGAVASIFLFWASSQSDGSADVSQKNTSSSGFSKEEIDSLIGDDPYLGSEDASVVLIEYSDFQCPFCRKFWRESFPKLKEKYIDTGKVLFIYKDFPLPFHPMAKKSASISQCAWEKSPEKWLAVHDTIFEKQDALGAGTIDFSDSDLETWVKSVGFDPSGCPDYSNESYEDYTEGSSRGIRGTPAFVIGSSMDDLKVIEGAYPFIVFDNVISNKLGD